jgi:putative nucleotidyltransferase with HDIG domain
VAYTNPAARQLTAGLPRTSEEVPAVSEAGARLRSLQPRGVTELSGLSEAFSALSRAPTREGLLESAARHFTEMLGGTACSISRLDDRVLREVGFYWPPPYEHYASFERCGYLLEDYPASRDVIESGKPLAVSLSDDGADPSEVFLLREIGMHALLMLPLNLEGRPWGLVEVYEAGARRFAEPDLSVAEIVATHVGALLSRFENADSVQRLYRETLASLSSALEAKDDHTSHHARDVVDLTLEVAERLGLSGRELRAVELGALLHDIGKIRVPESILRKPGPLTDEEWEIMRTHPEVGEKILAPISSLGDVLPIVRSHHERWDGAGYPDRLVGEEIPLGARIVTICDSYQAMTEARPYRPPLDRRVVLRELESNTGTQFDPDCASALLKVLREREQVVPLHRPEL